MDWSSHLLQWLIDVSQCKGMDAHGSGKLRTDSPPLFLDHFVSLTHFGCTTVCCLLLFTAKCQSWFIFHCTLSPSLSLYDAFSLCPSSPPFNFVALRSAWKIAREGGPSVFQLAIQFVPASQLFWRPFFTHQRETNSWNVVMVGHWCFFSFSFFLLSFSYCIFQQRLCTCACGVNDFTGILFAVRCQEAQKYCCAAVCCAVHLPRQCW